MSKRKPKPPSPAQAALAEFRPKGREQWGMFLAGMVAACYFAYVILGKILILLPLRSGWPVLLLFPVLVPAIYWLMCFLLHRFPDKPAKSRVKKKETPWEARLRYLRALRPTVNPSREKLSPAVFFGAFLAVFAVLALGLLANYPGGLQSTDIGWQWMQVQTGKFDTWHPPIHTMLIWLVTRVLNSYGFFIAVQVLFFSLLCGYMAATLRAWGLQMLWVVPLVLAFVCAHSTRAVMLYAYKDCMFTCFALWTMIGVVNIVLSHGKWLGKWDNRIALAVAMAFTTTVRVNGFIFTVPIIALLCVLYGKKQTAGCVVSGALALVLALGIQGPLYSAVGVTKFESRFYEELICQPMNILTCIYRDSPGALDEEGREMMEKLATPAQWASIRGKSGDYRSIKAFMIPPLPQMQEKLGPILDEFTSYCPPKKLASMVWHAVKQEPMLALKTPVAAGSFIWDPTPLHNPITIGPETMEMILFNEETINAGLDNYITGVQLRQSVLAESRKPFYRVFQMFQTPYRILDKIFHTLTPGSLLQSPGLNLLALMLCMWISLRRHRGWAALLLGLPFFANTIPGMLLMPGPDYRMLNFIVVITAPLILVCLAKTRKLEEGNRARHK